MGKVHVQRRLSAPVVMLVVIVALAALAFAGAVAGPAAAQSTYQHGGAVCANCHGAGTPTNSVCVTCHTGFTVPTSSYKCWTCHTPGQNVQPIKTGAPTTCTDTCHLANGTTHQHNPHPARGVCTTCHNVTTGATGPNGSPHHVVKASPTPPATPVTTIMTAKVAPTTVKIGKSVTVSGTVTPAAQLAGAKVSILVNRKVGTKWVKAKAASTIAKATGAYSWKYKVVKKGSYQVKISVAATSTFTAKNMTKTFKAK